MWPPLRLGLGALKSCGLWSSLAEQTQESQLGLKTTRNHQPPEVDTIPLETHSQGLELWFTWPDMACHLFLTGREPRDFWSLPMVGSGLLHLRSLCQPDVECSGQGGGSQVALFGQLFTISLKDRTIGDVLWPRLCPDIYRDLFQDSFPRTSWTTSPEARQHLSQLWEASSLCPHLTLSSGGSWRAMSGPLPLA